MAIASAEFHIMLKVSERSLLCRHAITRPLTHNAGIAEASIQQHRSLHALPVPVLMSGFETDEEVSTLPKSIWLESSVVTQNSLKEVNITLDQRCILCCCFSFSLGDWVGGWVSGEYMCMQRPEVDIVFLPLPSFIFFFKSPTEPAVTD